MFRRLMKQEKKKQSVDEREIWRENMDANAESPGYGIQKGAQIDGSLWLSLSVCLFYLSVCMSVCMSLAYLSSRFYAPLLVCLLVPPLIVVLFVQKR